MIDFKKLCHPKKGETKTMLDLFYTGMMSVSTNVLGLEKSMVISEEQFVLKQSQNKKNIAQTIASDILLAYTDIIGICDIFTGSEYIND